MNNNTISIQVDSDEHDGSETWIKQWLVKQGDTVKTGQLIAVIENHKVATEIYALGTGILIAILKHEGEQIKLDEEIGIIKPIEE